MGDRPAERPPHPDLPPPTWGPLEIIPVFLIGLVAAGILTAPLLALRSCGARFTLTLLIAEACQAGAVLVWVRAVSRAPVRALGVPRVPFRDVGAGLVAGVALVLAGEAAVMIVQFIVTSIVGHSVSQPEQVEACVHGGWLVASGPVVILAAPFGEELVFRGFFYRALRRRYSVWPSALISGAIFGIAHFQGVNFLLLIPGLALVGLGLALLFERRQSILATMTAHASFNLVGFLFIASGRR